MADDFKAFIRKLRDTADIVEVVESYNIALKRSGASMKACCPFHGEKTPSFHVSGERQSFKCFGCGEGGDVITFVQKMDSLEFRDAVEMLARRYNIPVPQFRGGERITPEEQQKRDARYGALEWAARFFAKGLSTSRAAIKYLQERGTDREACEHFQLGMAPDGWSGLHDEATRAGYKEQTLVEVGLIQQRTRGDGYYDRFRNRLIFPIHDTQGRPVAFGGRAMSPDDQPKYVNSPETDLYKKSQVLYGFHLAARDISKRSEAIVVEGYFDVIALHQHGFTNAVATCGTALTEEQARLVGRLCKSVIFLYDADDAGQKAMARGCEVLMSQDLTIRVATLTEGEDPDSFLLKHGSKAFEQYLEKNARDFFTFLVDHTRATLDDGTTSGRARIVEALAPIIAKTQNIIARNEYARRAAKLLGLNEADVLHYLTQKTAEIADRQAQSQAPPATPEEALQDAVAHSADDPYEAWERHLLWFVLNSREARDRVAAEIKSEYLMNATIRTLIARAIEADDELFNSPHGIMDLAQTEAEHRMLIDAAIPAREHEAGYEYDNVDPVETAINLLRRLQRVAHRRAAERQIADLAAAQESGEQEAINSLSEEIHDHHNSAVHLMNDEYKPLFNWGDQNGDKK